MNCQSKPFTNNPAAKLNDYTCSWTWITALKTKVDLKFDPLGTVHFIHPTELVFYYYFIVY